MAKVKDEMKVGRLKSILAKYDDDAIVYIFGGEDENGDFGVLKITDDEEALCWCEGDEIMLYTN